MSCLLPLLKNWAPVHDAAKPLKSLGFAYVRRLGRDTSILALTLNPEAHAVKEQLKEKGKGKGKAKRLPKQQKVECHGCDDCYDVDWEFKVKTVAKLWSMFCECFFLHFNLVLHYESHAPKYIITVDCYSHVTKPELIQAWL